MKIYPFIICAIVIFVISAIAFPFLRTTVLHKRSLQEIEVAEQDPYQHPIVQVDGRLIGGMLAIKSVEQHQKGACIVLSVKAGLARPGLRSARFSYKINVPNDVNEISFGDPADVIWRRKK